MVYGAREVAVNRERGAEYPALTFAQMWQGPKSKADNALPFVPAMSKCDFIERTAHGLTRDVEIRGVGARERMTFYPERSAKDYLAAVDVMLAAIRQAVIEGKL